MPLFLNSIISLSPLCLYTLRTTADGTASRHQLRPGPYTGEARTTEEEQKRTQPGTPEARHTRNRTQQHPATAALYNQEARKRKRTRKRDGISSTNKTINNIHIEQTKRSRVFSVCSFCFYGSITAAARHKGKTWQQARETGRDRTRPEAAADTEGTRTATTTQQQPDTQKPGMAADNTASSLRKLSDPAQSDYTTTKRVEYGVRRYYPAPPPYAGRRKVH